MIGTFFKFLITISSFTSPFSFTYQTFLPVPMLPLAIKYLFQIVASKITRAIYPFCSDLYIRVRMIDLSNIYPSWPLLTHVIR